MTQNKRTWLIRTKSLHLLGSISKKKLVELYTNGSVRSDDEISPGNGHWFFVREKNLVDRYLLGDEVMPFNPISDAPYRDKSKTLSQPQMAEASQTENTEMIILPKKEDLEYPT